jgi:hypothetical protein
MLNASRADSKRVPSVTVFAYASPSLVFKLQVGVRGTVALVVVSVSPCAGGTGVTDGIFLIEYLICTGAPARVSPVSPARWYQCAWATLARPVPLAEEKRGAGALAFAISTK